MEQQTLRNFVSKWETFRSLPPFALHASLTSSISSVEGSNDDPFECRSMETAPIHELADEVADEFSTQWRALDQRRIVNSNYGSATSGNDDDDPINGTVGMPASLPRWYEKHVRLPEHFDYTSSRRANDPPSLDDETDPERVISLDDPTITTSYHAELWHLFRRIPTASALDATATDTSQWNNYIKDINTNCTISEATVPHLPQPITRTTNHHADDLTATTTSLIPLSATRAVITEIETAHQQSKMSDGHALSRLRMNDRHDTTPLSLWDPENTNTVVATATNQSSVSWVGTMRFECLRQELRRTSTPESNRMVLEFLGTQTLGDVHSAIVELTHDDLFSVDQQLRPSIVKCNVSGVSVDNRNTGRTNDSQVPILNETLPVAMEQASNSLLSSPSGFFFIEDTFYTAGPVDYTTPIQEWLSSGNSDRERKRRCMDLGMSHPTNGSSGLTAPLVRDMNIRLDEISCRLGFRYVHVHRGDVECAIFVTDHRLIPYATSMSTPFPALHDLWSPSYTVPECDVCLARSAAVATSTTCSVTQGHVAVCETCSRQLELPTKAQNHILPYAVWREQADLSAGATNVVTW